MMGVNLNDSQTTGPNAWTLLVCFDDADFQFCNPDESDIRRTRES
jgi:hypothetical protein